MHRRVDGAPVSRQLRTRRRTLMGTVCATAMLLVACGSSGTAGENTADGAATEQGELPAGQHVHALRAADDGTLLLGLHGALWRSPDGGATWEPAGLEGQDAMAIGIDPDTEGPMLIAGHGVLARSNVADGPFEPLQPDALGSLDIHALAQAPSDPTTAYAFVVDAGLFETTDGGDSWQQTAAAGEQFGSDITGLAIDPTDPDTLLMGGGRSGLLRSADGGMTFEQVMPEGTFSLAYFGDDPARVAAITQRGVETSRDGGQTWKVVAQDGTLPGQLAALAADGDGIIWIVTEEPRTLQRSVDQGATWNQMASTS